ncbi:molybdopterin-binding protein [Desulforhopalus singaporensis]|uniref:Molybdopterin molybdenumtransferase n=1 Tax=Desulforhopalus singaporensis TaxID=91360 RepID=A0A1H0UTF8_9BACT|nr:molybdopterin-binding protein [Desulforhopalus singaporensis]SDP69046.1 Probable molybdopterin binding domain-containing protein [Desulforhopalus singaporensis]
MCNEKKHKTISVYSSVGTVLSHDITQVLPGKSKSAIFKRGHVISEQDIPVLESCGKLNLLVLDLDEETIHEDEAALRIARTVCGKGLRYSPPSEGKSDISAEVSGVLKVDISALMKINSLGDVCLATRKSTIPVKKNQQVAGTRIIPLTIDSSRLDYVDNLVAKTGPVINILPYKNMKVAAIVTGSEIATGLIEDQFENYVGKKIQEYNAELIFKELATDSVDVIAKKIREAKEAGAEIILLTGGLSIDADDVTRQGVRAAGTTIQLYGTPVLPGAMFLIGYLDGVTVLGLPACVFHSHITLFDLVFPRVLAGEKISPEEIYSLGHGGLCLNCPTCVFPNCSFGR